MRAGEELREALRGLVLWPAEGTAYRLTGLKHMASPLSPEGSLRRGGRYNKKGVFAALYLADSPAAALAEVQMLKFTDNRLAGVKGPPKVLVSVDYALRAVLDLRQPEVLEALGATTDELRAEWLLRQQSGAQVPTQELGEAAYALGTVEALWAPSARLEGASNLVVFPDRLHPGSHLTLYDPDGLLRLSVGG